jgi:hypothetical protein
MVVGAQRCRRVDRRQVVAVDGPIPAAALLVVDDTQVGRTQSRRSGLRVVEGSGAVADDHQPWLTHDARG